MKILLIAQLAPPSQHIAARRVAGLLKYLGRQGHDVTMLASPALGTGGADGARRTVRSRDLLVTPLNWRRSNLDSVSGQTDAGHAEPSIVADIVVPDLGIVTWFPFAAPRALSLAREEQFDCVITTAPAPSVHLIGHVVRRLRGVPWIADFHDGWVFEPIRPPWPTAPQRALDARLERVVVEGADRIVTVSKPIADDLLERYGTDVLVLANGYDREEDPDEAPPDGMLDPAKRSFVHTGRMAAARATPKPLLDALRLLKTEDPALLEGIEFVFAGPFTDEERDLLSAPDLEGVTRFLGALPREQALRLQRAADVLLLVAEGPARKSVVTGKLFEYFAAGRPILAIAGGTEAARLVEETQTGVVTPVDDPPAIAAAIHALLEDGAAPGAGGDAVAEFSWEALAGRLGAEAERLAAQAASSAR